MELTQWVLRCDGSGGDRALTRAFLSFLDARTLLNTHTSQFEPLGRARSKKRSQNTSNRWHQVPPDHGADGVKNCSTRGMHSNHNWDIHSQPEQRTDPESDWSDWGRQNTDFERWFVPLGPHSVRAKIGNHHTEAKFIAWEAETDQKQSNKAYKK